MPQPILEQGISQITDTRENNRTREEDLETVQVEPVDLGCEAQEQIVEDRSKHGGGNAICTTHKKEEQNQRSVTLWLMMTMTVSVLEDKTDHKSRGEGRRWKMDM